MQDRNVKIGPLQGWILVVEGMVNEDNERR
jgi:hypothetical protein